MKLNVENQESYSRGELILRTLFGFIYIGIPHNFLLFFLGIASSIVTFIAFWAILFTGRYPQSMYEFQEKVMRWQLRVRARLLNLCDGYPAFGLNSEDDHTDLKLQYPEHISRGKTFLRQLFGFIYVIIPHFFILIFRMIATQVLVFIAWWAVLFTGKYPAGMHEFVLGTLRWGQRVSLYMGHMSDIYPPFSGKSDEELGLINAQGASSPEGNSSDEAASSDQGDGSGEE